MPCNAAMLAEVDLFELMSDEDREMLAQIIDMRTLAGGDILYKAGEPGESLFVVRSGEIERSIRDTAGQEIQLSIHSDNDIFGELALLDRAPRSATATALTDTELLELDREDLLVLFEKSPARGAAPARGDGPHDAQGGRPAAHARLAQRQHRGQ